ncbi:hypothetical protein J4218_03595 [Candidatus Pacearchaeota archaeon]|nr:hypothetical protein [Candidatus Pacearchaeota archaeon]
MRKKIKGLGIFVLIVLVININLYLVFADTVVNNYYGTGTGTTGYSGTTGTFTGGTTPTSTTSYTGTTGTSGYSGTSGTTGTFTGGSSTVSSTAGYDSGFGGINVQYTNPSSGGSYGYVNPSQYWGDYGKENCNVRQDIFMQILPFGCSPAVVRSDLLEEQNVPVFCKVMSIQANPLIDVSRIRSISFSGKYPKGVSGVSYYPARAAIAGANNGMRNLEQSPVNTEMGYLVIVLARQPIEANMTDFVEGNITASIDYDSEGAYGIGKNNFYLSEMSDADWQSDYKQYGFWNGKGYIRAESIEQDTATIGVYRDDNVRVSGVMLKRGETSKDIFLPGFYCAAGLNIRLEGIDVPVDSALLQINDQQIWVAKGDTIMDGKCKVTDLRTSGGGGNVMLNCPGKNGKITLSLTPGKASFTAGFGIGSFAVGDKISEEENVYLAYLGNDVDGRKFAVLVKDGFSDTKNEFAEKGIYDIVDKIVVNTNKNIFDLRNSIISSIQSNYLKKFSNIDKAEIESKVEVYVLGENEEAFGFKLDSVAIGKDNRFITSDSPENEKLAFDYYSKSVAEYEELADLYPGEKRMEGEDPYAAIGLYEAGKLSKEFDMNAKAQEYYDRLVKTYPDSNVARMVSSQGDLLKYDTTKSKSTFSINNQQYIIDLLDFKKPKKTSLSAVILIDEKEVLLGFNEIHTISRDNETLSIQLRELKDDYVVLKLDRVIGKNRSVSRIEKLMNNNGQVSFEGINIKLLSINLDKQAKVVLIPKSFGTRAQSNFSFKVGIEKRAINLSTEQSRAMLDSLMKSLKQWEDINNKLGNVVRVMKGACFATSAVLMVKTYLNGINGASIARNAIMTSKNGWNDICAKFVSEKKYSTLQQCLLDKSAEIDRDVQIYGDEIKKTNDILKGIQNSVGKTKTDILDFSGQVDQKKVEEEFKKKFDEMCGGASGSVELPDKDKTIVPFTGANGICNMDMTHEQRRNIYTLYNVKNSGSSVLNDVVNQELGKNVLEVKNYEELNRAKNIADANGKNYNVNIQSITPAGDSVTMADIKRITKSDVGGSTVLKNFKEGSNVVRIFIPPKKTFGNNFFEADPEVAGKEVIVEVKEVSGAKGTYTIGDRIYTIDGKEVTGNAAISVKNYMSLAGISKIKQTDNKAYHNQMVDAGKLVVKYFDRTPYKGLPAEVPFDINEGWYVELTYILTGFGKPYDESGRPINFYICNVGDNGKIEFKQSGDDICRYYNAETGADLNFPGMSAGDSRNLVSKAINAINEAAKQYGKDRITINGNSFKSGTSFGGEDGRCSDFMSPTDCNILFNVCDPVICPSSRCDLGGEYRVDNVIQSGIIGSLTLCLPNMREGIAVPICLSGVNAGLESYISILNSTAQCLNESLETGRNIGICDEIKSIYICDFFWKQATPFLGLVLPRLVEGLYGQGTRGGGEYLTVKKSWENTQNAITYFTNQYAVNSMQAFSQRNTELITTTDICKNFASFSTGGISSLFRNLIEPDSPVQFSAWFSENVLTTATIPPTSHYKVYYHIYSGKDVGSYFSIYLKNPTQVSNVNSIGYYTVARGFIPRGGQVDEARDFTGPAGFKQLCVNVNGKDECGFGSVSTSYMLNSLSDKYVEQQIRTDIKSEKECVSGTPSVYSLINPNLQAGVENSLQGQLYNQGIIRVCASENPGKKVLSTGEYDKTNSTYDRWKDVGYCDDPTIKCWLDTNSVKSVVNNKAILNETLDRVNLAQLGVNDYWTTDESMSVSIKTKEDIDNLMISPDETQFTVQTKIQSIETNLNNLKKLGNNNFYRARGYYLLANLYRKVAEGVLQIKNVIEDSGIMGDVVPGDEVTVSEYGKVEYSDIGGIESDSQLYVEVYENNELVTYEIKNFDYNLQTVTLYDGSVKKVGKDFNGRIIFIGDGITSVDDTNTGDENFGEDIVDIDAETSGYEFMLEFQDGTSETNLYYRYTSEWLWSFNNNPSFVAEDWHNSPGNYGLNLKNQAFVNGLSGKSCEDGLKDMAMRTIKNEEGGYFSNAALVLNYNKNSKTFSNDELMNIYKNPNCAGLKI